MFLGRLVVSQLDTKTGCTFDCIGGLQFLSPCFSYVGVVSEQKDFHDVLAWCR